MAKPKVLVFLGTSRQGAATVDALLESGNFDVYATTRNKKSAEALKARCVKVEPFKNGDKASAKAALDAADPSLVFFTTLMGSREVEGSQGKLIVDAIKEKGGVQHVVYSSVAAADVAPDAVGHFKSKLDVEEHLKASGLGYSILRPVAFFENYDDPMNYNPLKKGSVKGLWQSDLKVKHVACRDIGKAAAVMLSKPAKWKGKTLDCASDDVTGADVAAALTEVSRVECIYGVSMPRFILRCAMKDLNAMIEFFEDTGFADSDVSAFKTVVPDAQDCTAWFKAKGAWANGEKFGAEEQSFSPFSGSGCF